MTETRAVLVSGHRFGLECYRGIRDSEEFRRGEIQVAAVFGLHPSKAINVSGYSDLYSEASLDGVSSYLFESIGNEASLEALQGIVHDYMFVVGLSQLVPQHILDLPMKFNNSNVRNSEQHGCIGMHPTLLPLGRGRAPLPWTILKGMSRSGVTAFFLEETADSGAIIDQVSISIDKSETVGTLFAKVSREHYLLGRRIAGLCARREVRSNPQDIENATFWPKRSPSDGWIDFNDRSDEIERKVRALGLPYPPSFFVYRELIVEVEEAKVLSLSCDLAPGTVLESKPTTTKVVTKDGSILLMHSIVDKVIEGRLVTSLDE